MRDNGQCKDAHTFVYFAGYEPQQTADCQPNEVEVPRVVGARVLDATARLAQQPLQAQVIYRWARPGIERPGIVLEQTPASGTLAAFDTVRLLVARAKGTIPKVVGLPLAQAQLRLADRQLEGLVDSLVDGEEGIVIAQAPGAGIAAGPNMTVHLVIGKG
jgi:beta-lactam-binding protein with PASTA domain